jgi:hypothetical protein
MKLLARDWFRYRSTVHLQTQAAAHLSSEVRQHADESQVPHARTVKDLPLYGRPSVVARLGGEPWNALFAAALWRLPALIKVFRCTTAKTVN